MLPLEYKWSLCSSVCVWEFSGEMYSICIHMQFQQPTYPVKLKPFQHIGLQYSWAILPRVKPNNTTATERCKSHFHILHRLLAHTFAWIWLNAMPFIYFEILRFVSFFSSVCKFSVISHSPHRSPFATRSHNHKVYRVCFWFFPF